MGGFGSMRRYLVALALAVAVGLPLVARAQGGSSSMVFLPITQYRFPASGGPTGTTSLTLIEEAEASGAISHEAALTYAVYALFGDSRLPAQYHGAPIDDSQVMAHVRAEYASLSATARADLAPFLLPPNAPGSWMDLATISRQDVSAQAIVWRSVTSTTGVKVWYQTRFAGDDAKAVGVAAAIDGRIYTPLQDLMKRTWLPDGGLANNGGGAQLDVYLVQGSGLGYLGLTTPYTGCEVTPAWINIDSAQPLGGDLTPGMVQTTAHEMLHAVQFATAVRDACSTYDWLAEASATWFMHYTYRYAQAEQPYAPGYLNTSYWPLENSTNQRWYGAYVYPFFLTETLGSPYLVGTMWDNSASMDSLKAVNDSGADFESNWKDFARDNWNDGPDEAKEYQDWDTLTHAAHPFAADKVYSGVSGTTTLAMPTTLEHLSIQYQHIYFTDDTARSVIFYNGLTYNLKEGTPPGFEDEVFYYAEPIDDASQKDSITVQALFKIEGDDAWKIEDWTQRPSAGFCRDTKDGRVEELVLIYANSEHDDANPDYTFNPQGKQPTLLVSDIGCYRWEGTVTATYVGTDDGWAQNTRQASSVVFERAGGWGSLVLERQQYTLTSGTLNWAYAWHSAPGESYDCFWFPSGSTTFTLGPGSSFGLLETYNGLTGGAHFYSYMGFAQSYDEMQLAVSGEGCDDSGDLSTDVGDWFVTDAQTTGAALPKFTSGDVMDGSYTDGSGEYRYTWHLEAKREN